MSACCLSAATRAGSVGKATDFILQLRILLGQLASLLLSRSLLFRKLTNLALQPRAVLPRRFERPLDNGTFHALALQRVVEVLDALLDIAAIGLDVGFEMRSALGQ